MSNSNNQCSHSFNLIYEALEEIGCFAGRIEGFGRILLYSNEIHTDNQAMFALGYSVEAMAEQIGGLVHQLHLVVDDMRGSGPSISGEPGANEAETVQ